jgi:hypothetical protein
MPRHRDDDNEDDDWSPDWDEGGDDFGSDDDEEPTIPCPHCRAEIHEDAQQCPACGEYLSEEDSHRSSYPPWVIATAVIVLLAVIATYVF